MKNQINRRLTFFSALLVLLLCPTFAFAGSSDNGKTSAADVQRELQETLKTIGNYTADQRAAAVEKAKEALAKTDARIEQLQQQTEKNWQSMSANARRQARKQLKNLRKQRTEIAEWYGGLKHSSTNAWSEVKKGFTNSYKDLMESLEKAREEF